jgi:hypothetical protein
VSNTIKTVAEATIYIPDDRSTIPPLTRKDIEMTLIAKTEEALSEIGFKYRVVEYGEERALIGKMGTESGCIDTVFMPAAGEHVLQLIGNTNHRIPLGALPACLELTRLVNSGLVFGVFTIDGDRDLMVRSSTIVNGDLSAATVAQMIAATTCAVETFVPAFLSVIYGNEEAKAAFRQAVAD